jgi:hypothetical protein
MNSKPLSQPLEEAFIQCRDMDASLAKRLQAFADAVRRFGPHFQHAVDGLVERLRNHDVGENAPKPGKPMPNFICPTRKASLSASTLSCRAESPNPTRSHRVPEAFSWHRAVAMGS